MIKTKKLFNNISGIFSKKTDSSSVTSRSMFDSKISNINLILDSSETAQGSIISEPAIPTAKTEPHVSPKTEHLITPKTEPPIHPRPEPLVTPKTKSPVHTKTESPVTPNTEPLVHTVSDPYKKGMQEINKLKLQLEQMEISRKSSSKICKIINY